MTLQTTRISAGRRVFDALVADSKTRLRGGDFAALDAYVSSDEFCHSGRDIPDAVRDLFPSGRRLISTMNRKYRSNPMQTPRPAHA